MTQESSITLPDDIWLVIRQVIEATVTAKGREGTLMLLKIFDAFDEAGIVIPEIETEDDEN
jgi:hypothetical protein